MSKKIKNKIRKIFQNPKILTYTAFSGLLLIGLFIVIFPETAFAAADNKVTADDIYKLILGAATYLLQFVTLLLWPILTLIGALMDNTLIFGANMEDRLLMIWQPIRNFVNIAFVIILIVVAFYNVIGKTEGDYTLKQVLPKFVIALIAINFSTLICKVVLDSVNVLTTSVAALNVDMTKYKTVSPSDDPFFVSRLCAVDSKYKEKHPESEDETGPLLPAFCTKAWDGKIIAKNSSETEPNSTFLTDLGKKFFKTVDKANLPFILCITNIANLNKLNEQLAKANPSIDQLSISLSFAVVITIVFGFSYAALCLVLIARICVIWIVVVLAPLAGLFYVLPSNVKSEIGGEFDLSKMFIQHAIAPFNIIACLTIGNIMIDAYSGLQGGGNPLTAIRLDDLGSSSLTDIASTQDLLIAFCTVGIVWTGVFAAASKTMAKGFTDKIKSFVEGTATKAGSMLKYLPLPVGIDVSTEKGKVDKKNWTMADFIHMPGNLMQSFESQQRAESSQKLEALSNQLGLGRLTNGPTAEAVGRDILNNTSNYHHASDPAAKAKVRAQTMSQLQTFWEKNKYDFDASLQDKVIGMFDPSLTAHNNNQPGIYSDLPGRLSAQIKGELEVAKATGDPQKMIDVLNRHQPELGMSTKFNPRTGAPTAGQTAAPTTPNALQQTIINNSKASITTNISAANANTNSAAASAALIPQLRTDIEQIIKNNGTFDSQVRTELQKAVAPGTGVISKQNSAVAIAIKAALDNPAATDQTILTALNTNLYASNPITK